MCSVRTARSSSDHPCRSFVVAVVTAVAVHHRILIAAPGTARTAAHCPFEIDFANNYIGTILVFTNFVTYTDLAHAD